MEPAASYTKKGIHTKQLKVLKTYLITNFKHELKNFWFSIICFLVLKLVVAGGMIIRKCEMYNKIKVTSIVGRKEILKIFVG